ncbi:MAG TPA: hydroxymyristoyl-ACP dehydratase [Usitatibacter sp.]|jgi:predicted hotdog family 3-hydroxylacyl-ACP dehydratase
MCLLDRVVEWDAQRIRCAALNHHDADHPLREGGGLPVWAGIEYAAQAAAVHGSLLVEAAAPRTGVLGRLRNVRPACQWLDRIASELVFGASLMHRDPAGGIYTFEAHGDGRLLLQGQFTLVFTEKATG